MKLLIADPDREFVSIVTYWLGSRGHQTIIAYDAKEALKRWLGEIPDLAVIDLSLPGAGRVDFCRQLRQAHTGLILVLTDPTHEEEEVHALEQGADDYLRKPISMRQLQARIMALARRAHAVLGEAHATLVKIGPTNVNLARYEVTRNGRRARLTPIEGRLLQFLLSNAGHVVSAETIIQHIWGYEHAEAHLIKTHIHHLRRKIEPDPTRPRFLLTLPTVGYLLRVQGSETEDGPPASGAAGMHSGAALLEPPSEAFSRGA
jgi:DNA-binding response OmpR family regulator